LDRRGTGRLPLTGLSLEAIGPLVKFRVKHFKSMNVALKELEPFVRDGRHLQVGKPFANFGGQRSREILANWLLCAVANADEPGRYTLATSPLGGDGVIADTRQGDGWVTEHIIVPDIDGRPRALDEAERLILEAVDKKHKKGGAAYASGKTLVVFMNAAAGSYFPNRLVRGLPEDLAFDEVWVVGLEQLADRSYVYTAAVLKLEGGDAPSFRVRIAPEFDAWAVERIQ
jgi:hypothetical protein